MTVGKLIPVNHPFPSLSNVQDAAELLSADVMESMAREIHKGGGNEVFFVGRVEQGIVVGARVLARGNAHMVPALLQVPEPGDVVLHNHPSGELTPSDEDGAIASHLGQGSVGFYIVDNAVGRVYPVVSAFVKRERLKLADDGLAGALQPGGPLAGVLPSVEDRPAQRAMLAEVTRAFNDDAIAILEAGTGTGKTFAYLLPAIDWAIKNQTRVVVATHTINLQEQIIRKDAEMLRAAFPEDFRISLMKGRGNYISKRRTRELEESLPLLTDDVEQTEAQALVNWAGRTEDGSRADLPFQPKPDLWERIQSETDNCLRHRCPTFHECFFFKARRAAAEANVIVVNHHLLFVDIALRSQFEEGDAGILPKYDRIILDEAHHVEEVATDYFGQQVTRLGVQRALNRMWRESPRGARGVLTILEQRIISQAEKLPEFAVRAWVSLLKDQIIPARMTLDHSVRDLFDRVHTFTRSGQADGAGDVRTVRITAEVREQAEFRELQLRATRAMADLEALINPSRSFIRKIDTFASEINVLGYLSEFESSVNRLAAFGEAIKSVLLGDSADQVRWFEVRADNPRVVRLQTAPIDVGELLAEHLFNRHKTVVLTSATLSVSGKMKYLRQRTGLDRVAPERVGEEFFPSPFDYAEQARFFVTSDLPSPDQPTYEAGLQNALPGILRATGGRAFVLFTSMRSLQIQHRAAQSALEADGIRCLKQGDAPRDKLLKIFREDRRSVLFGTDSFWEGVDVEGEALSAVILTRLPFRVPTHPVLISRAEAIDAAGGRAFTQYVVPMAVIKFRQGFGRLIRSRSDRGVVIVTDGRIISKPYGKTFLKSLPPMDVTKAPATEIEKYVREFFDPAHASADLATRIES